MISSICPPSSSPVPRMMARLMLSAGMLTALAAGTAGLLCNFFSLDVFGGARITLGGTFPLAVALLLGPAYGALAAVLAELPNAIVYHAPWVCVMHALEAMAVGWFTRRGG